MIGAFAERMVIARAVGENLKDTAVGMLSAAESRNSSVA